MPPIDYAPVDVRTAAVPTPRQVYRRLRSDGMPAGHAYRASRTPHPRYRADTDSSITLLLEPLPLPGITLTAVAEPDEDPDLAWLGEFVPGPAEDTVRIGRGRTTAYFRPAYTLARRRAALARLGYARGRAYETALREIREDALLARDADHRYVRLQIRLADVLLGEAGVGLTLTPNDALHDVMAHTLVEHQLIEDVVEQAGRRILALFTAVAA